MKDLRDALTLVTGAGSGIGRATALRFAQHGARVLCIDIVGEAAEKTAAACAEAGAREAVAFTLDVSDAPAVARLAERVHTDHGVLDVLVNNAGVGMTGGLGDMTIADWEWIRSVNLDGVVHGCHAFGPAMVKRGRGHVVNVASGLAYTPRATEPAYVATKAAVLALSQSLRADWGPRGVGVSAICPGIINTPIVHRTAYLGSRASDAISAHRLFARGHEPDKVARAIIRAIGKDRAVVPVGIEARGGWLLHRFGPRWLQGRIARQDISQLVGGTGVRTSANGTTLPGSEAFVVSTDDGASIHGEVAGDGPTVVLSHCWTGTRAVWADVARELTERGMRVVTYDHRGHGSSTAGSDGLGLERLAKDLVAVLESTDARDAVLAGHSLGGMTIQTLALLDPSVIADRARGVVLVATSARGIRTSRVAKPAQRIVGSRIAGRVMSSAGGDRFARGAFGRRPHRDHVTTTREMFAACDATSRAQLLGVMHAMDLRALDRLDVPVTVVAGARDRLTHPRLSHEIAQRLGADIDVVPDAGHMLPLEAPARVAQHIAGLASR